MIKSTFTEDDVLTLTLEGRIDTSNATTIDKEIAEIIASYGSKINTLVFDCSALSYISSTGLRIIIKYKKLFDNLRVVNVNNDIYNILELTGFTKIISIEKAMRKIDLSNCSLMAKGGNASVYRVNDEEIIKVMHLAGTEQAMRSELQRSKAAFILGIPTAISFDIVDCMDGRQGAVYEALSSDTLGHFIHSNPGKMKECAIKYANLLKTLHSTEAEGSVFTDIKHAYFNHYQQSEKYYTADEKTILHDLLDMIPERTTLVHADAHTNNILMGADGELMFIDMADTALGHPIFDYAGIALSMIITMHSDRCFSICGMDKNEIPPFLSTALAYSLGITEPSEIKQLFPRLVNLAFIKQSMVIYIDKPSINSIRPLLLEHLRKHLFDNIEQVKQDILWFIEHT